VYGTIHCVVIGVGRGRSVALSRPIIAAGVTALTPPPRPRTQGRNDGRRIQHSDEDGTGERCHHHQQQQQQQQQQASPRPPSQEDVDAVPVRVDGIIDATSAIEFRRPVAARGVPAQSIDGGNEFDRASHAYIQDRIDGRTVRGQDYGAGAGEEWERERVCIILSTYYLPPTEEKMHRSPLILTLAFPQSISSLCRSFSYRRTSGRGDSRS
jgi:hypothetical protein